jgi:addiction module RelE/StbE family toxin
MKVIISPKAFKDLEKLYKKDKFNYEKIKEGIQEISKTPYRSNKMKHYLKGTRKIRKGDYRIIFIIHTHLCEIEILKIGKRNNIYKQL